MTTTRQDLVDALSHAIAESAYQSETVMETGNWAASIVATDAEAAAETALQAYDTEHPAELAALQAEHDAKVARRPVWYH